MKRCPECYELYDDGLRFCETDGQKLLDDPAYSPERKVETVSPPRNGSSWWLAATLGVLIGIVFGGSFFAVVMFMSKSDNDEHPAKSEAAETKQPVLPERRVAAQTSAPTPEPDESPSPAPEEQPQTEPSPPTNTDTKTASAQLNQGPISTGEKTTTGEDENTRTIIEMNDGSTLDVEAAWEDKQGIWYRRSGLVSFVDSSRVKSITSRRDVKVAEAPHR